MTCEKFDRYRRHYRVDAARMAAQSWPHMNPQFSRRWMDPQAPPHAPAGGRAQMIRSSVDPEVLKVHATRSSGPWPSSEVRP
jgi:hypothetical protein